MNGDGYSDVFFGESRHNSEKGRVRVFHGSSSGLSSTVDWTATGSSSGDWFGASVASAGDTNGDGYSDLVIGSPRVDKALTDAGEAGLFLGGASGLANAHSWAVKGTQADDFLGRAVCGAGDFNGDGYADVAVSRQAASKRGEVRVYHGSASGLSASIAWSKTGASEPGGAEQNIGTSLAGAGDVNGDGDADLIYSVDSNPNGSVHACRVYHGSSTGLEGSIAWHANMGAVSVDQTWRVASAGDVNGDCYADVLLGLDCSSSFSCYTGETYHEKPKLFLGSPSGVGSSVWARNPSGQGYDAIVSSAGDVNGDGYSDFIIGEPSLASPLLDKGRALVFHGGGGRSIHRRNRLSKTHPPRPGPNWDTRSPRRMSTGMATPI